MFGSILRFELGYQLRGAAFIAVFALFFLLVFGAVTLDQLQIGSSDAVNINSPSAAASTISVMAVMGIFMPVVFMATAVIRDVSLRTDEMFGSTPVGRRTMLLGRYVGGLIASWLCFLSVPLAFWIGTLMPWLDQEQLGPHNVGAIFYYYAVFGALNMAVLGSILFTVANLTRSLIATWVALVAIFIGKVVGMSLVEELETRELAALLEPFGLGAFFEATRYWTPAERNTEVAGLTGVLLQNRLLWGGVAVALLLVNLSVPNGIRGPSFARFRRRNELSPSTPALRPVTIPRATPAPVGQAGFQQFMTRTRFETFGIVRSVAFWVVLVLSIGNTHGSLLNLGNMYGSESYPVTRLMVGAIQGGFTFVPLVIAVYYTAELVWRERSFKFNEIVDATPTPSWAFVSAKFVAVVVVLVLMYLVATGTAVATQLSQGYTFLELDQYAIRLFFFFVVGFTLLTVVALFLQVVTNNKWLGIGAILGYFVVSLVMDQLGFDHALTLSGAAVAPASFTPT